MSELSLEVLFAILENVEVKDLLRFSSLCTQYRDVCKSKTLWVKIFNGHGLVILRKSKSLGSWVANFYNSLIAIRMVNEFTARPIFVMAPINLKSIRDVSIIHVPGVTNKDELQKYLFLSSFVDKYQYCDTNILGDIDTERCVCDGQYVKLYLMREGDTYLMSISETDRWSESPDKEYAKYRLSEEQARFLLYRLTCHFLLRA
ncbi:F-box domain-containing protein [Cedratvirus Zaza IHUMI]|uniref:F-box domain-containing protein n=1 Tax=Cedratvirus Zaza IHUMI TaxID=2126979 RepID=A0A2R8FEK3_9VIRU|nr:F-box domain-containing protein [Cedratvirus Zaza IHUMI]